MCGALACVLTTALWIVTLPGQTTTSGSAADPGRRPSRLLLSWRDDPARSQAVTWRTESLVEEAFAEIAEVTPSPGFGALARRSPARTTAVPLPSGTVYYHEARFTALRPNTLYAYRVGDGAVWSEWNQFRTAAAEPAPFSFIYLGDAQEELRSLWSRVVRTAVLDAPKARFMVHAGDLVSVGESDDQWGEWFGAAGWTTATLPQMPAVGDREYLRLRREDPAQLTPLWRHQFALPEDGPDGLTETVYSFDYQGARFIVLNTEDESRLADQAAWVESRLRDSKHRWRIVIFHRPVESLAVDRDNPKVREAWQTLFDRHDVDLVLQGHDHMYGRGEHVSENHGRRDGAGTVYVVSVSGARMLEPAKDRTWATRTGANAQLYQIITVAPHALRYESKTVTGQLFDAFDISKSRDGKRRLVERKLDPIATH